jgi:hypothetical protein
LGGQPFTTEFAHLGSLIISSLHTSFARPG